MPAYATPNTTDLPVRVTIEAQSGQVYWNQGDGTVTVQLPGGEATIKAGTLDAVVQGKTVKLATAPYVVNNLTWISADDLKQIQDGISANPVVLAFSSVGDSRLDSKTPAPSKQDAIWLNNSKVVNRMEREIVTQKSSMTW